MIVLVITFIRLDECNNKNSKTSLDDALENAVAHINNKRTKTSKVIKPYLKFKYSIKATQYTFPC